jgi:hypothetical protein
MFDTTIRVSVAGKVREYPTAIAEYGTHLAEGGTTLNLSEAMDQAAGFWKLNAAAPDMLRTVVFWATLDGSGLAYRLEFARNSRRGVYAITGAAPMPGYDNVSDVYVA